MKKVIKYNNRKLYSHELNRYTSLKEIASWIKAGQMIEVKEHRTENVITNSLLKSILIEANINISNEDLVKFISA